MRRTIGDIAPGWGMYAQVYPLSSSCPQGDEQQPVASLCILAVQRMQHIQRYLKLLQVHSEAANL